MRFVYFRVVLRVEREVEALGVWWPGIANMMMATAGKGVVLILCVLSTIAWVVYTIAAITFVFDADAVIARLSIAAPASIAVSSSSAAPPKRVLIKIGGNTYDIAAFMADHPGGPITFEDDGAIAVTQNEDVTERFLAVPAHGNDFGLLDRDSVVQIDSEGKAIAREKKFYEDYGGKGGSWREFIGRRGWFVLHSFAAKYPQHPSEADRAAARQLVAAFGQLYVEDTAAAIDVMLS